jgi:acyl carrier protein
MSDEFPTHDSQLTTLSNIIFLSKKLYKMKDTKDLVLNYIIKEFLDEEGTEITYDTPLISSGLVDSFSMVSLLVFIENKFRIKIPPSMATPEAFDSVNKIDALVNQYLK